MSYWDLLPPEMRVYVLRLRDNQALIEHRESVKSRNLCDEIYAYGLLRDKWRIGHIEVKPKFRYKKLAPLCKVGDYACCEWVDCFYPRNFGHYVDSNGEKQRIFSDYFYASAMYLCDLLKSIIE